MLSAQTPAPNTKEHLVHPAFISQPAFLGAAWGGKPDVTAHKKFAFVGIPYDGATTNRPGARFGPSAIRQASKMLCDAIHPLFGLSPTAELVDYGDLVMPTTQHDQAMRAIETGLAPFFAANATAVQPHLCVVGGDHSITLSLIRLHAKRLGKPLALVHFDAHCDTWEDHFSEPSGHGTWVHEAVVQGLVDPKKTVQIGLRSSGEPHTLKYIAERGGIIQNAHSLRGLEGRALAPNLDAIRTRIGDSPVYLTVDIDCLDPAYAPGTGTPEPAGMTTTQLLTYLEELHLNWQGMDCVEVAPIYDHAELTALTAAQVVWTYLCRYLHAKS